MKWLIILAALLVGSFLSCQHVLQTGQLLRYLDSHPDPKIVPPVEFYVGEGFYLMHNLEQSATYYIRIAERYPKSSYADEAYYQYLLSIDDMGTPRMKMADLYETYLERFPNGPRQEIVQKRIEYCRNTR